MDVDYSRLVHSLFTRGFKIRTCCGDEYDEMQYCIGFQLWINIEYDISVRKWEIVLFCVIICCFFL